jgi:hypothetical protein
MANAILTSCLSLSLSSFFFPFEITRHSGRCKKVELFQPPHVCFSRPSNSQQQQSRRPHEPLWVCNLIAGSPPLIKRFKWRRNSLRCVTEGELRRPQGPPAQLFLQQHHAGGKGQQRGGGGRKKASSTPSQDLLVG